MSVLALGLAETTVLDERLAEKSLAALQADALARSGVAVAAVVLAETGAAGAPDTLGAPWAVDVGRQPLGPGWVEVQVEDEARRLDLNAPGLADAVPRPLPLLGPEHRLARGAARGGAGRGRGRPAARRAGGRRDRGRGRRGAPPRRARRRPPRARAARPALHSAGGGWRRCAPSHGRDHALGAGGGGAGDRGVARRREVAASMPDPTPHGAGSGSTELHVVTAGSTPEI